MSQAAQSLVQLRQRVVAPQGETRADTDIIFDLACRLGLGAAFWDAPEELYQELKCDGSLYDELYFDL